MYRLQLLQADKWSLLDEHDDEVFRGSLTECETWLDGQENLPPARSRGVCSEFKLRDWIHRIWSGTPIVPLHFTPATRSTPEPVNRRV